MKKPHLELSINNVNQLKSGEYIYDARFNVSYWSNKNLELAEFLRFVADKIEKEYNESIMN